jgi:hypothetical protein
VVLIAALALTGFQVRRAGAEARRARAATSTEAGSEPAPSPS